MANTEVIDTLEDIKKWAKAYEILVEWHEGDCDGRGICGDCGFRTQCAKAVNLVGK